MNAHGFVRGTRDVDVIVSLPLDEARRRLRRHGVTARLLKGDPLEGGFPCLKGVIGVPAGRSRVEEGVPFDVLPQLVPFEAERALVLTTGGHRLRVVDMETLIRLKLKAGAAADLYDVGILVLLHPDFEERAQALAVHDPGLAQRLRLVLEDPRTRAKAREISRQDKVLRAFGRRNPAGRKR